MPVPIAAAALFAGAFALGWATRRWLGHAGAWALGILSLLAPLALYAAFSGGTPRATVEEERWALALWVLAPPAVLIWGAGCGLGVLLGWRRARGRARR